jgi:hypothetical protein
MAEPSAAPIAQADPQAQVRCSKPRRFSLGRLKDGDRLVLKDASTNMTYQLDDQAKAKKYEGKDVKVNGSFDANSNTIHVDSIEAAAS